MTQPEPRPFAPHAVDVHALLRRSVASLYSHLVTRPTGRAVRLAIESQLEELSRPALSLVDLSSVAILDYSCADEVVAKLLLHELEGDAGVYIVLAGVQEHHRETIEAVLERRALAVVAETERGRFEPLGAITPLERSLWGWVEGLGRVPASAVDGEAGEGESAAGIALLLHRRLLFRDPSQGDLLSLSSLVQR